MSPRPASPEALAQFVRDAARVDVPLFADEGSLFAGLRGEIEHDVADGVVSCLAGTPLAELNAVLARDDRCIPHATVWPGAVDRLASLLLLGLPHGLEGRWGTWRDWILGATMVTAEGEVVRSGSRVVKSVAGYDAHKLLIGSRGVILLPVRVVLRTFHVSSLSYPQGVQRLGDNPQSILRVRPTDLAPCLAILGKDVLGVDESTATVWTNRFVQDLPPYPYAWSCDPRCPTLDRATLGLTRRAKAVLDPGGKLAPGAFHNL